MAGSRRVLLAGNDPLALGGIARYWCSGFAAERFGETFPWGTIIVNIVGSFIIGFFATLTGPDGRLLVPSTTRQFVMVGLCGGFTTFSSFGLETLNLARDGEWLTRAELEAWTSTAGLTVSSESWTRLERLVTSDGRARICYR